MMFEEVFDGSIQWRQRLGEELIQAKKYLEQQKVVGSYQEDKKKDREDQRSREDRARGQSGAEGEESGRSLNSYLEFLSKRRLARQSTPGHTSFLAEDARSTWGEIPNNEARNLQETRARLKKNIENSNKEYRIFNKGGLSSRI